MNIHHHATRIDEATKSEGAKDEEYII